MVQAANGCAADPTELEEVDGDTAAHFIATPGDGSLGGTFPVPPRLSVFTTYRDSTRAAWAKSTLVPGAVGMAMGPS